ncbi:MAG: Zn-ribbon domain-containing OB-fold protein [Actinomycetes bacterium]
MTGNPDGGAPVGEVVEVEEWAKPLPGLDNVNEHYWRTARAGRLLIQECPRCGHRQWYPRALCTACGGDPAWLETAGRGVVHTYTVIRQQGIPAFKAELPYVVAMVELEEGPMVFGSMPGVDPALVSIGTPVEVWFAAAADDTGVPYWRPR